MHTAPEHLLGDKGGFGTEMMKPRGRNGREYRERTEGGRIADNYEVAFFFLVWQPKKTSLVRILKYEKSRVTKKNGSGGILLNQPLEADHCILGGWGGGAGGVGWAPG